MEIWPLKPLKPWFGRRQPQILDHDLVVHGLSNTLWFMLHGYTDRNDFDNCRMHEHVSCCYLKAPKGPWWWRAPARWKAHLAESVALTAKQVCDQFGCGIAVFAGHSDGAEFVHQYAVEAMAIDVPVECIVHYAGLWDGLSASCPCVPVLNDREPIGRIRRETGQCAKAYGRDVLVVDAETTRHRWAPEANEMVINEVTKEICNRRSGRFFPGGKGPVS